MRLDPSLLLGMTMMSDWQSATMSNDLPWEGPDLIPKENREVMEGRIRREKLQQVKESKKIVNGVVTIDLTPFAEASDTDDMAGDFKVMRRYTQAKREQNLEDNKKLADDGWTVHTEYHWSRTLNGKRLDYWPSRNKFQYEGNIHHGDVHGFVRKREGSQGNGN